MSVSRLIGRTVPFAEMLGIKVAHREPGLARLELDMRKDLENSRAEAHGGVVMTLADIALAAAAITLDPRATGAITVELKVSFLKPGKGTLFAEGRCLRAGRTLAFSEGEIRDADGKLLAKALGTFSLVRGPVAGDAVLPGRGERGQ